MSFVSENDCAEGTKPHLDEKSKDDLSLKEEAVLAPTKKTTIEGSEEKKGDCIPITEDEKNFISKLSNKRKRKEEPHSDNIKGVNRTSSNEICRISKGRKIYSNNKCRSSENNVNSGDENSLLSRETNKDDGLPEISMLLKDVLYELRKIRVSMVPIPNDTLNIYKCLNKVLSEIQRNSRLVYNSDKTLSELASYQYSLTQYLSQQQQQIAQMNPAVYFPERDVSYNN